MTLVEPLPDLQWGKGTWQDYISNWRTRDTNWMQERLILRYQTTALRNTDWASPKAGQVVYNDETKNLEMYSVAKTSWLRALMFQYLTSNKDDSAGVQIGHTGASGKGLTFGPSTLSIDMPSTSFLSGTAVVDATGLAIKVGTKTAKLSTDATHLVSDSPIKATGLDLASGTGTVISAAGKTVAVGTLIADQGTITAITMTGTLTGGVINGTSGTIGSVGLGLNSGVVSIPAGSPAAFAAGIQAGSGYFYGDGSSATMRHRTTVAAVASVAYVQTTATVVNLQGTTVEFLGQPKVLGNRSMQYVTTAATPLQNGGPVIYGTDPGVANVPEGTIWLSST